MDPTNNFDGWEWRVTVPQSPAATRRAELAELMKQDGAVLWYRYKDRACDDEWTEWETKWKLTDARMEKWEFEVRVPAAPRWVPYTEETKGQVRRDEWVKRKRDGYVYRITGFGVSVSGEMCFRINGHWHNAPDSFDEYEYVAGTPTFGTQEDG